MRIERAVNYVTTLGPGRRLCIWVNGCPRSCRGCVSERLRIPDPTCEVDIYEYFADYNIENADGVTVSGGEPFMQKDELLLLVKYLRSRGVSDILVYTGYTIEELREMRDPAVLGVLSQISVLIDGPYIDTLDLGKGNMTGSENQRIIYLDESVRERYEAYISDVRAPMETVLGSTALAIGIPDRKFIEEFNRK